jgi:hypothetical protein
VLNKLKQSIKLGERNQGEPYKMGKEYQPSPPVGFVPRTDPNFYFLSRR